MASQDTDTKDNNDLRVYMDAVQEATQDSSESVETSSTDSDYASFHLLQEQLTKINDARQQAIETEMNNIFQMGLDNVWIGSGWGSYNEQIHNNYAKLNRFHTRYVMDNYVRTGYLFMTRPMLNLQFSNLQMNRKMKLLSTMDPKTIQFAIRSYLDTRFARMHVEKVANCPFIDYRNPFFTIITNNVTDFSGGPSYQMAAETEEAGYYGESQSVAIGSDSYKKPFDLQLSITEPIGGPIDAIMQYWTLYMELIMTGEMIMYPDQAAERVLNYTVSFYRFIMDPSMTYIRKMAKYTGCFPISLPGASVFDFSVKDMYVDALRHYNISFRCGSGHVDVDDPKIAEEFDMLVERYFPNIRCLRPGLVQHGKGSLNRQLVGYTSRDSKNVLKTVDETLKKNGLVRNPLLPEFNYCGIPYIIDTPEGVRLDVISQEGELPFHKYRDSDGKIVSTMNFKTITFDKEGQEVRQTDEQAKQGQNEGLIVVDTTPLLTQAAETLTKTMQEYQQKEDTLIASYIAQRHNALANVTSQQPTTEKTVSSSPTIAV